MSFAAVYLLRTVPVFAEAGCPDFADTMRQFLGIGPLLSGIEKLGQSAWLGFCCVLQTQQRSKLGEPKPCGFSLAYLPN